MGIYLNNPNYFVKQNDVLSEICMEGEKDVNRICHSLGIIPQRGERINLWTITN